MLTAGPSTEGAQSYWFDEYLMSRGDAHCRMVKHYAESQSSLYEGKKLDELRPDLFPADRVTAEICIMCDKLGGIFHSPLLLKKLTAE